MNQKKKYVDKNGLSKDELTSVWFRAFSPTSKWPDKDEFLDVIYWARQIIGVLLGLGWGLLPLKGFFGIALFCLVNAICVYVYSCNFQKVDAEEYGGIWELIKEGFMTSFAGFLVTWIMVFSITHFD